MKLVMYIRFESPLGNAELAEENKGALNERMSLVLKHRGKGGGCICY
jgi:hypothetical protein